MTRPRKTHLLIVERVAYALLFAAIIIAAVVYRHTSSATAPVDTTARQAAEANSSAVMDAAPDTVITPTQKGKGKRKTPAGKITKGKKTTKKSKPTPPSHPDDSPLDHPIPTDF